MPEISPDLRIHKHKQSLKKGREPISTNKEKLILIIKIKKIKGENPFHFNSNQTQYKNPLQIWQERAQYQTTKSEIRQIPTKKMNKPTSADPNQLNTHNHNQQLAFSSHTHRKPLLLFRNFSAHSFPLSCNSVCDSFLDSVQWRLVCEQWVTESEVKEK